MSKKNKYDGGLIVRDTVIHQKTKDGITKSVIRAAPDDVILTANAEVVLKAWENDPEIGVQKIAGEYAAIVERSPIPQLDHLVKAITAREGRSNIQKIYEHGVFRPLLALYERLADLISENVSARKQLTTVAVKENIQKNPDFFYGKLRQKFSAIVEAILFFEDEKKRNYKVFKETVGEREQLRCDFETLNAEAQKFLTDFRTITFQIEYGISEGVLTGENLQSAKKIAKSLRKDLSAFGTLIVRIKDLVPKATSINETLELLFRFANDSEHKARELSQKLQLWETVFEPDIDPYVAFEFDMEVVYNALDVNECKAMALGSAPIEIAFSEKYEEKLKETREALNLLNARINCSDYQQDSRLSDDEQLLQRILVVTVYGITCLATRSQGRRTITFFRVLCELDHLSEDEEGLFQKVFDFSVRVDNPLIVKNETRTGEGYDVRQKKKVQYEFFWLTELGKRQAQIWSKDFGDLAQSALDVVRKFDRALFDKKPRQGEFKEMLAAKKLEIEKKEEKSKK